MLDHLRFLAHRLESGISELGYKVLSSEHPIVPMVLGETDNTAGLVDYLFAHSILVTGLKYPVVPRGDEEIRFQVSASHTEKDIDFVLHVLENYKKKSEREK